MTEIKAYQCVCGKVYAAKSSCRIHEKKCFHNPETKSCITCADFTSDFSFRQCEQMLDISSSLRTKCDNHKLVNEGED